MSSEQSKSQATANPISHFRNSRWRTGWQSTLAHLPSLALPCPLRPRRPRCPKASPTTSRSSSAPTHSRLQRPARIRVRLRRRRSAHMRARPRRMARNSLSPRSVSSRVLKRSGAYLNRRSRSGKDCSGVQSVSLRASDPPTGSLLGLSLEYLGVAGRGRKGRQEGQEGQQRCSEGDRKMAL